MEKRQKNGKKEQNNLISIDMKMIKTVFVLFVLSINLSYGQIDTNNIIKKAYIICLQEYFNDYNISIPSNDEWKILTDSLYCTFKFLKQKGFEDTYFFYIDIKSSKIYKKIDKNKYNPFSELFHNRLYFASIGGFSLFKMSGFYDNEVINFFEHYFLLEEDNFATHDCKKYRKTVIRKHLPFTKSIRKKYYVEELDIVSMIKYFKHTWQNKYFNSIKRPFPPPKVW